ncbi:MULTISPECIES: hypothetical protein [Rhizobium/Agrobacterium group]|uniref:Uncharacterized protein n=2 Tax=Rhizobium/Agrobacterium group TaxID=227290 RepID=A0AAE2REG1_AGRVI|nr:MULTISPECIES: hypothetical protein [Rhizobium/Agrobacterium group]MBF2715080.1 hypothetical protein [Agrobacterium vitis]MCF1470763.1 hypothetical protein [Allorhizobium ampelinum]
MRSIHQAVYVSAVAAICALPVTVGAADEELPAQIEAARAEALKLMEGMRVSEADIAMSLPLAPITTALDVLNAAPAEQRTITVRSTGANGYFWKDDPTWCGSFAELGRPDGFQAAATLSNFGLEVPDPSSIIVNVKAAVSLQRADVHWHFRGRRVSGPFGIGNVCPPGGGFGGHIGGTGETSFKLRTLAKLSQNADEGGFRYDLSIVAPPSISMTLRIGFQNIGDLGLPQGFNVPQGALMSGKIPLLFENTGTVKLPNGVTRNYTVRVAPKNLELSPAAISGYWTGKVEFAPAS